MKINFAFIVRKAVKLESTDKMTILAKLSTAIAKGDTRFFQPEMK
jgi:hypothetical protein